MQCREVHVRCYLQQVLSMKCIVLCDIGFETDIRILNMLGIDFAARNFNIKVRSSSYTNPQNVQTKI